MTTTARRRHLAHTGLCVLAAAAALLTGLPATAAAPAHDASPRHFQLAARTARATVWAERCVPPFRPRRDANPSAVSLAPSPQPDPDDLSAVRSALRHGNFQTSGVRIVETDAGPMLKLAGRHPGAPDLYFMICDATIRTSFD